MIQIKTNVLDSAQSHTYMMLLCESTQDYSVSRSAHTIVYHGVRYLEPFPPYDHENTLNCLTLRWAAPLARRAEYWLQVGDLREHQEVSPSVCTVNHMVWEDLFLIPTIEY